MELKQRYTIKKDAKTDVITYKEYENLKGYNVKPKPGFNLDDMVSVNKMIIINPTLIEKLVDKKCQRKLEKILKMLTIIYEEDDDTNPDGTSLQLALNEIEKFRSLVDNKYKEYMKDKEYKLLIKKIEILKSEIKLRQQEKLRLLEELENKTSKKGR